MCSSDLDGFVEVKFKPISGGEDQAGGLVWRWKDGDNYYVARANALENNVSLYYTEHGSRKTLKYVDAPVARGAWHTLRVEFAGTRIAVSLDGKRPAIVAFVDGVTAAAIGAITGAVILIGQRSITDWVTAALALVTVAVLWRFKKIPEPVIVLVAALIGLVVHPLLIHA